MNRDSYCIIMAGGQGKRFWPISNKQCPKQFCDILHTGKSFLRQTFERASQLFPREHIFVVTGINYEGITREQLPELPVENILKEPIGKNTAPCIAYAAYRIARINPDATMVVVPSDHFIDNDEQYNDNIVKGVSQVEIYGGLLTIGIKPFCPETGYGYIQLKENSNSNVISKVKAFTEKPNENLARSFLLSGDFLWNAGIFIWKVKDIIEEFKMHLTDLYLLFEEEYKSVENPDSEDNILRIYSQCPNISIDFGIMEKSFNVFVMKCEFGWSDVGTWHSFYDVSEKDKSGNVNNCPNVRLIGTERCIVCVSDEKEVVVAGVRDCIIAEKDGVLMICHREHEDKIQYFDNLLKYNN